MKKKSGQILVVVLLVVVIALAVGLSVASRNLTNLKSSTQAEQSQRAFTAAEGGVENALSNLNNVATDLTGSNGVGAKSGCKINSGIATCSLGFASPPPGITVDTNNTNSNVIVTANTSYERVVQPGDVAQVNLQLPLGATWDGIKTFKIKWAKKINSNESSPYKATLEFTFVCDKDSTIACVTDTKGNGAYGQHREAVTVDTISSQSGGFTQCGTNNGTFLTTSTTDSDFYCSATFTPANGVGNLLILRIKPFWNSTTVNVSSTASNFPVQSYNITSTATTDSGLSRKVQVSRDALPQLPAIFDYVLYSGQDIIK